MNKNSTYFWRKLHSLTGIFPLTIFMLEHIFTNSLVLQGPESFNRGVEFLQNLPHLWLWKLTFIFIPLFFHGVYGVVVLLQAKNNTLPYSYYRNWMFYLQRVTGVIILVFLFWHFITLRYSIFGSGDIITFSKMSQILSNPLNVLIYLIGFLAAIIHFANGISTFLISWGITIGEKSQKFMIVSCWGLFVILAGVGLGFIRAFVK